MSSEMEDTFTNKLTRYCVFRRPLLLAYYIVYYTIQEINVQEICGATALLYASLNNTTECSLVLLKYGADPNIADYSGVTPLFISAMNDNFTVGFELLVKDANPNSRALSNGASPLHLVVRNGNIQFLILLIRYGANLNATDSKGNNALYFAGSSGNLVIAKILIRSGADLTRIDRVLPAIRVARMRGHFVVARCIEKEGNWARRKSLLYVYLSLISTKHTESNLSNQYAIRTLESYDMLREICLFL